MTSVVVVSPPPPLLLQARVEALELQRHACPTTIQDDQQQQGSVTVVVDESMRRARSAVEEAGLYSAVWTWVPPDYYTKWSLQARADYLNVPNANVDYLCKSLLLENKKVSNNDDDSSPMDRTNPKFIFVVLQYAATLDVKKLVTAIRAMRPNVRERLDENAFDVRVASPQDNATLTGYEHNSVTPFGLLQPQRILVVLSKEVVPLRRFWMGGGHVNLKLSMAVSDFVNSPLNPVIADISNPRTGLDLKSFDAMADFGAVAPPQAESGTGSGGAAAAAPSANSGGGAGAPAAAGGSGGSGTSTPLLANNNTSDAVLPAAVTEEGDTPKKEKKHKKRDKDKKNKHRSSRSKKDSSSSSASQTSEESKEKKVGEGYIVHLQWDDHNNVDDQSAITSPAFKVKKTKKDKDKSKKKSKKHRSKTILEEEGGEGEGGVIVEESATTTSGSNNDQSSEPSSSQAAAESSPKSSNSSPLPEVSSKDHPHPMTLPTLPDNDDDDNNNNLDEEDSPGKMHRFQSVGATAPALPVAPPVPDVKAHTPKMKSRAMTSDLQAIMKRRREMAETLSSDNAPTAALLDTTTSTKTKKSLCGGGASSSLIRNKSSGMSSDLQAIMARRRRMAGDADEDNVQNDD